MGRLAGEFVLGTLRGPARRRFERWRASSEMTAGLCGRTFDLKFPEARTHQAPDPLPYRKIRDSALLRPVQRAP